MRGLTRYCFCWCASPRLQLLLVAQSGYRVITVADGGTISGTIKWSGPVPHSAGISHHQRPADLRPRIQEKRPTSSASSSDRRAASPTPSSTSRTSPGQSHGPARTAPSPRPETLPLHSAHSPGPAKRHADHEKFRRHPAHHPHGRRRHLQPALPLPRPIHSRTMPTPGWFNLRCNGGHVWMNAEMFVALILTTPSPTRADASSSPTSRPALIRS
jgi:hypothetical protein